ncbi:MAG TPA: radical SAM family heme chaperone HemW [Planctomycetota bacterium]|nr:radical SAM family heme chaperone HemW [Planctomycetota bacterium]
MRGLSLYVHVPFCASRCPYCDFATAPAMSKLRARYVEALAIEIRREGQALGRPRLRTIYVGGGTPSLLEPDEVAALSAAVGASFEVRPREVTVEVNPATLDRARLEAWVAFGATRMSIGAQSFAERGLRELGRTHSVTDVAPAVDAARSRGLAVNLDLIFGWPGQTPADWTAELDAAVALGPDHLSCYPLELALEPEEAVANWPGAGWPSVERWRRATAARQADDRGLALLYALTQRRLARAGFVHYEIANWAVPGSKSLHNLTYWRNGEWLGVGTGAHSHLGGVRSHRPGALGEYLDQIERGAPRAVDPGADERVDGAMLGLRLDRGLDLARYAARFGSEARDKLAVDLATLEGRALLRWSGQRVRLTPRGRILANEVFVQLVP